MMIDRLLAYEAGDLTDEQTLDLFRDLVASGLVWYVARHLWKHGTKPPPLPAKRPTASRQPGTIVIRRDALGRPKDPTARRQLSHLERWCEDEHALTPAYMDSTGLA